MEPKYYRWVICGAGMIALFCTGGLLITGFNVYTPYLISEGGLSDAEVSLVLLVRNLFSLLSMFLVVPMIRKLDIRLNITIAVLSGAAAFAVFSAAQHVLLFCLGMALAGLCLSPWSSNAGLMTTTDWRWASVPQARACPP